MNVKKSRKKSEDLTSRRDEKPWIKQFWDSYHETVGFLTNTNDSFLPESQRVLKPQAVLILILFTTFWVWGGGQTLARSSKSLLVWLRLCDKWRNQRFFKEVNNWSWCYCMAMHKYRFDKLYPIFFSSHILPFLVQILSILQT